MDTPTLIDVAN